MSNTRGVLCAMWDVSPVMLFGPVIFLILAWQTFSDGNLVAAGLSVAVAVLVLALGYVIAAWGHNIDAIVATLRAAARHCDSDASRILRAVADEIEAAK